MKAIPMSDVREFYARNQPDGHWFDAGTMKFFKTKLPKNAFELRSGGIYFITSEVNPSGYKRYSIRRQMVDGNISTVGEFHSYISYASAKAALAMIEKGE